MHNTENIFRRRPDTLFERFWAGPLQFLAPLVYQQDKHFPHTGGTIRVVCISDSHNAHERLDPLPEGDILIHAGDLTQSGTPEELDRALTWISSQPHPHKLFIGGNHDKHLGSNFSYSTTLRTRFPALEYLENSFISIVVRGRQIKIHGSPYTPLNGSMSFQYPRLRTPTEANLSQVWSHIPLDADILVTHGPPAYHLDHGKGCLALLQAIWRVRPRLHVFGHIHSARGIERLRWTREQALYEQVMDGRGGWWKLLILTFRGIINKLALKFWTDYKPSSEGDTVLINAACMSDDNIREGVMRGAAVIDI